MVEIYGAMRKANVKVRLTPKGEKIVAGLKKFGSYEQVTAALIEIHRREAQKKV